MLTDAQQSARESEFERELEREIEYFDTYKRACGFKAIWSIFHEDVKFGNEHPFGDNVIVVYQPYGDSNVQKVKVLNNRWGDVYNAADRAICQSGNLHHIFIEGFEQKGNELHLSVGS